jgi:membrane associated rhomboid family serine protease
MSEGNWPLSRRIADSVLSRFLFRDRPGTKFLVTAILVWYLFQIGALYLGWDKEVIQWVFTTESFPVPSPGLFFAIISHAFPPQFTHLFGNVGMLWLFAGESEQHMQRAEVVGFFGVTALAAVLIGTAVSGDNTMGASGGVLAFIGFYCVHTVLKHRDDFEFDELTSGGPTTTPVQTYWGLILVLTPIVLVPYMLGQLAGLLPVGRADVVGHLVGFLCGMGYAAIRSRT